MIFRVWKCHQMNSPLQPLLLYPLRLHITLPCSTQEGESKNAVWLNYYQLSRFERVRPLCRLFVDWAARRVLCKTMLEAFWSVGKFAKYKPLQIAVIKLERKMNSSCVISGRSKCVFFHCSQNTDWKFEHFFFWMEKNWRTWENFWKKDENHRKIHLTSGVRLRKEPEQQLSGTCVLTSASFSLTKS